jgi:hypothetical protein
LAHTIFKNSKKAVYRAKNILADREVHCCKLPENTDSGVIRVNPDANSATVAEQPLTSNAPFNAPANVEATSSALET